MHSDDTIAAISTPPGRGGIGVVRLSGPSSLQIARSLFHSTSDTTLESPNSARYGRVADPSTGEAIDTAVATFFKAPRSYTGEDVVELSCHGSPVILGRVLNLTVAAGARIAEPGEFTLRAFLNGRMDLAQAQAVKDLIDAQTGYQARVAARQLEGGLSSKLAPLKHALIDLIVHLESSVEFVEDDISTDAREALLDKLRQVTHGLHQMAAGFSLGRFVREGFDLAVVGRPNVGKSSVFNRLVGNERAIVTEIPGTTRDTLHETSSISGIPVRLIDTAGIRETADVVESIGINRSRMAIADADICLLVMDSSEPFEADDERLLLGQVPLDRRIVLLNKIDLPRRLDSELLNGEQAVEVSALNGGGFDELTNVIFSRLSRGGSVERDDVMITDARQHEALRQATLQLSEAERMMMAGELEEIVLLRLRGALSALGEITGETLTEDILSQIFSTFCIGK